MGHLVSITDEYHLKVLSVIWFFPQVNAFKDRLLEFSSPDIDIAIGHYISIDQELNKTVLGDIRLFAITIVLMMSYAGSATLTSRSDFVYVHVYVMFFFLIKVYKLIGTRL